MQRDNRLPILALAAVVTAAVLLGSLFMLRRAVGGYDNVEVRAAESAPEQPVAYASYREALADLEVGAARALAASAEERDLVAAFEAVLKGDTSATGRLEALRAAKSAEVRRLGLELLGQQLLATGRWAAFAALADSEETLLAAPSLTRGDLLFARSLATVPPERFVLVGSARVPTDRVLSGCPEIVVRVNGRIRHFVLDTGASVTVLTSDVAETCEVEPLGTESATGQTASSEAVEFRPAVIGRLELGDLVIENHPTVIVDSDVLSLRVAGLPVMKLDGIIGWPVFRHFAVRIDPDRGWTTFTRARFRDRGPRNLAWLGYPVVTLHTETGRRLNFGLDTGAARSGMRPRFLDKLPAGSFDRTAAVAPGAGDKERVTPLRIRDVLLHLDGHELRFDQLATVEGVRGAAIWEPDGKLGFDVGGHGAVVIDWPAGRFELEP